MVILACEMVLAGHDRVHQVEPGFAHVTAEDFFIECGPDLGPESVVAARVGRGLGFGRSVLRLVCAVLRFGGAVFRGIV